MPRLTFSQKRQRLKSGPKGRLWLLRWRLRERQLGEGGRRSGRKAGGKKSEVELAVKGGGVEGRYRVGVEKGKGYRVRRQSAGWWTVGGKVSKVGRREALQLFKSKGAESRESWRKALSTVKQSRGGSWSSRSRRRGRRSWKSGGVLPGEWLGGEGGEPKAQGADQLRLDRVEGGLGVGRGESLLASLRG